jgi:hypothetical protein
MIYSTRRSSSNSPRAPIWLQSMAACVAPAKDSGDVGMIQRDRVRLRGQRSVRVPQRSSQRIYRASRGPEPRHRCGDGGDAMGTERCDSGANRMVSLASRCREIRTRMWRSKSFGGGLRRLPATWLRRRAVGCWEEDEDSRLLIFFLFILNRYVGLDHLWSRLAAAGLTGPTIWFRCFFFYFFFFCVLITALISL